MPNIRWLNLKNESLSVVFGYNNFWQINANQDYFTRHVNSPFIHFWYIAILMQFELLFPLVFTLFKKIDKKLNIDISSVLVFILMIVSTIYFIVISKTQEVTSVYYNTFARLFSIFFGIMLAILHHGYNLKLANRFNKIGGYIFLFYCIVLTLFTLFTNAENDLYALNMIIVTIISCRLIEYAIVEKSTKAKTNLLIIMFAKVSYEIYLVQYPVIFFVQNLAIPEFLRFILIVFLTIVFAFVIYVFLNTKKKVSQIVRNVIVSLIVIVGMFLVIIEPDYTEEMKELETKLAETQAMIEAKNNEFLNGTNNTEESVNNSTKENENKQSANNKSNSKAENVVLETQKDDGINEEDLKAQLSEISVVGIGDSVFLDAIPDLYKYFPNGYFDGKISRNINAGRKILEDLDNQGKLPDTVILALANNGDYSNKNVDKLMEVLGNRKVYWIDAVGADDPNYNDRFKAYTQEQYPNVRIISWVEESSGHDEWFYKDRIHPKPDGTKVYAELIYNSVYDYYLKDYKESLKQQSKTVEVNSVNKR